MLRILGKKARRVFREEFITGIREHRKAWSLPGGGREDARSFLWSSTRHAHSSGLYVHHTIGGVGRDSAAVTIGLLHALERFQPGVGYFRPIDQTTIGGHRSKLMKQVFKLRDQLESMQAMTQEHAYELVTHDRIDDLLEEILKGETDRQTDIHLLSLSLSLSLSTHSSFVGEECCTTPRQIAALTQLGFLFCEELTPTQLGFFLCKELTPTQLGFIEFLCEQLTPTQLGFSFAKTDTNPIGFLFCEELRSTQLGFFFAEN